jgi:hypothetical protein
MIASRDNQSAIKERRALSLRILPSIFAGNFEKENTMARDRSFRCEVEESNDTDENGNRLTTIKCHGELITATADKLKEVVSPSFPLAVASLSTLVM